MLSLQRRRGADSGAERKSCIPGVLRFGFRVRLQLLLDTRHVAPPGAEAGPEVMPEKHMHFHASEREAKVGGRLLEAGEQRLHLTHNRGVAQLRSAPTAQDAHSVRVCFLFVRMGNWRTDRLPCPRLLLIAVLLLLLAHPSGLLASE